MEPTPDLAAARLADIPHARALGLALDDVGPDGCIVRVPWAEHLVGDPDTGVVHGGVLTALLDNASGIAVRAAGQAGGTGQIATLDLRIDYMRPARPHRDILCRAVCWRVTRNVAFVRGSAWDTSEDDPIATSTAAFMLGTPASR